jgi:menaquinone-dependent protoporphyrinogen oxidase
MKTLILYGSHKGCTRSCAEKVSEQIGGSETVDLARSASPTLDGYDTVVLGSSIWAGKVHPKVNRFVKKNLPALLDKRLGLFICSGDDKADHIGQNYPASLVEHAQAKAYFGGALNINDYNPLVKFILKKKAGVTESYNRLKPEVISQFSKSLRNGKRTER